MTIASGYDTNGKRFVFCHECERGGNGTDPEKCSCGWQVTAPSLAYCYLGEPIAAVREALKERRPT